MCPGLETLVASVVDSAQARALWRSHSGGNVGGPPSPSSDTPPVSFGLGVPGEGGGAWFGVQKSLKGRPGCAADSSVAFGK